MSTSVLLELKLVGNISGCFFVARYQRGYRWGSEDVRRLLDDLWEHRDKEYSLQPIVVKKRGEKWELVDGQQRLTTLYLLLNYMKQTGLQNVGPMYELQYETREGSERYLAEPDAKEGDNNIDYFQIHIHRAWKCIRAWFDELNEGELQYRANKLYSALFENVNVIWYEAPEHIDSATLFTRLNVGRIPLTDAELVKAQLLSKIADKDRPYRASGLTAEWDRIERDLRRPDVWAFVTTSVPEDYPTRITLLLDTVAEDVKDAPDSQTSPRATDRQTLPRYFTFEALRKKIEAEGPNAVWDRVVDLHGLVLGWFESRDLYHKIGYLVAVGQEFAKIVSWAQECTKRDFMESLDKRIRDELDLSPSQLRELSYDDNGNRETCRDILLLMNVETILTVTDSSERYPFRRHRERGGGEGLCWSLEHIHAQQAEGLTTVEQWTSWLNEHRKALLDLPTDDTLDELIRKIDDRREKIERKTFEELAREITEFFTLSDDRSDLESVHSIANLALLPSDANSALNNAVFEVKRRRILELNSAGAYIPICTRRVFLKYYTKAGAQQIHFWGPQDREDYLEAMISLLSKYLRVEESQ